MRFDYPKNIRFKCLKCALCCGDAKNRVRTILLLQIEAKRISQETYKNIDDFAEKIRGHEPYAYSMKKSKEGKCVFLRDNLCSIYQLRPLICRFYPFQLKNVGINSYVFECTDECPGIGKGSQLKKRFFESLFRKLTEFMGNSELVLLRYQLKR